MTDTQLDIAASPRRIFTVDEANRLLPSIEETFRGMDMLSARARELSDLIADLEAYWAKAIEDPENESHAQHAALREDLTAALRALNEGAMRLSGLGCELKDPNRGLVDFYGYVNGDLVYLCWQRGESEVGFWHTLEAGFPGRRPLQR
ncbi:MAG TPA: DUF2203 domain-containing protein [Thermoplasmata archaeon]|nr:DUF2203 domain-containing protein [Thermoplasmata archaeon]